MVYWTVGKIPALTYLTQGSAAGSQPRFMKSIVHQTLVFEDIFPQTRAAAKSVGQEAEAFSSVGAREWICGAVALRKAFGLPEFDGSIQSFYGDQAASSLHRNYG